MKIVVAIAAALLLTACTPGERTSRIVIDDCARERVYFACLTTLDGRVNVTSESIMQCGREAQYASLKWRDQVAPECVRDAGMF